MTTSWASSSPSRILSRVSSSALLSASTFIFSWTQREEWLNKIQKMPPETMCYQNHLEVKHVWWILLLWITKVWAQLTSDKKTVGFISICGLTGLWSGLNWTEAVVRDKKNKSSIHFFVPLPPQGNSLSCSFIHSIYSLAATCHIMSVKILKWKTTAAFQRCPNYRKNHLWAMHFYHTPGFGLHHLT